MSSVAELRGVLERARAAGFLGPGPVEPHIRHAEGFAVAAEDALGGRPANVVDLGTGGGIPGLALGLRWRGCPTILVETGRRRAAFLRDAVAELNLGAQVEVLEERGEAVGRMDEYREQFELVTARSFGAPAITAEIAAGLVRTGGVLVVSEPPEPQPGRWPADDLRGLGFGPAEPVEIGTSHFARIPKHAAVPDRYPRAVGRPAKRPLW